MYGDNTKWPKHQLYKEVDNVNECASTIIIPSNHIKAAYLY